MLVFWKARLVLLAVPKTATTALQAALRDKADSALLNPPALNHVNVRRWRTQMSGIFEGETERKLELMAVMREPVSWLSSWYRYRARPEIAGKSQSTAQMSFEDFVEEWLRDSPREPARVGRQSRFLSDAAGRVGVDHLFRHDRLAEAVRFLEERLSTSIDLGVENASPPGTAVLPEALLARLRTEARADFDLWDALGAGAAPARGTRLASLARTDRAAPIDGG